MRRDHIDALGDLEAGRIRIDDECRDAARARRFAGACEHDVEVGDAAIGDPGLLAIENEVVGVGTGRAGHRRNVGTSVRLGQRKRRDRLAAGDAAEITFALLRRSGEADRARPQPLHREREVGEAGMARERFADEADRAGVDRVAHCMVQPSRCTERAHERPALRIDVRPVLVRHMLRRPGIELTRQRAVLVVEERPVQIARVAHGQFPSKRGFCLAANAS